MKDIDYIKRHKTEIELFPNQTYADVFFKFGVTSNSLNLCAKMAMRKVENKIEESALDIHYAQQARRPWKMSIMMPSSDRLKDANGNVVPMIDYWDPMKIHFSSWIDRDSGRLYGAIDPIGYQNKDHHSDSVIAFGMSILAAKSLTERRTERRNDVESEPQPPVTKKQNKIKKIWKHKWEILKAIWTLKFSKDKTVRLTIATRRSICMSNACQKLDRYGTATDTIWKGKPACGVCGCNVLLKASYLPGECALKEVDQEPLWKAFITEAGKQI